MKKKAILIKVKENDSILKLNPFHLCMILGISCERGRRFPLVNVD
jgi:hypothetical protein